MKLQAILIVLAVWLKASSVDALHLRASDKDFWIFNDDPDDEDVLGFSNSTSKQPDSRRLTGCKSPEKTWFNVVYDLQTSEQVSCSADELKKIGYVLGKEFDNHLEQHYQDSGNVGPLGDFNLELEDVRTKVCRKKTEMIRAAAAGGQAIGHDGRRRKLVVGYRIHLFRGMGKCFMCRADNLDRRRDLQQSSFGEPLNYFNQLVGSMESSLGPYLTSELQERVNNGKIPCLRNEFFNVKPTVAIKLEELDNKCDPVYCCGTYYEPELGCSSMFGATDFCHTTKERCEGVCTGWWMNAQEPPTCLGWYKQCQNYGNGNDDCCPGSVCHTYDGYYHQCVPWRDLQ